MSQSDRASAGRKDELRKEAARKLEAARTDNRQWRHELAKREKQLQHEKERSEMHAAAERGRYAAALAAERSAAAEAQRQLAAEEQRLRTVSREVSAIRGMIAAAQRELGEVEASEAKEVRLTATAGRKTGERATTSTSKSIKGIQSGRGSMVSTNI